MAAIFNAQGPTQAVRPDKVNPYRGLIAVDVDPDEAAFEALQTFGMD